MSLLPSLTTDSIVQAAEWLKKGYLLTYPTESVWGIGCDPFNERAVKQLLAIKQRPVAKGMIVVTDSATRIAPLLALLQLERRQDILDSWTVSSNAITKQAHTWLLPLPDALEIPIPPWITGAHNSVAVRVIAHPLIQKLCREVVSTSNPYGFIVSTSCNPSGQSPAVSLKEAQHYFAHSTPEQGVNPVTYLQGEVIGYSLPSQIRDALTGSIIR